jgi:crotonobetaine/carnitine-CoA ligase
VSAPERPFTSIGDALEYWATERPDRTFLHVGEVRLTYRQALDTARAVAGGLADLGLTKGDRLATIAANRAESVELYLACALLGIVQVPINIFLKGEFLRYQLADAAAVAVVVDDEGLEAISLVAEHLPDLKYCVTLDSGRAAGHPVGGAQPVPYSQLRTTTRRAAAVAMNEDDLMSIVYTSGTTGMPKGCLLTHGYYLYVAAKAGMLTGLRDDDVVISALPLFHGAGRMMVVAGALRQGITAVVEPAFSTKFLSRAVETGASVMFGVAAMGRIMLSQPPSDLDRAHRLRVAVWGPSDAALEEEASTRFGFVVNSQTYGQTECACSTYAAFGEPASPGSAGRAAPELEMKLVDDADNEVPVGEVGEILFRPAFANAMFRGYWGRPDDTVNVFRGLWYHTGDYGRVDANGSLFFVDRKKDYLRRRGENVSSMEVEAAIRAHPAVAEVAVHAVASELTEDDIKACIVLNEAATLEPHELFAFFVDNLPYFAVPRYVEILPELPKNAVARVMKHVLGERGLTKATWDFEQLGLTVAKSARR